MPTGWRPKDVAENYPIIAIEDPAKQVKYETENSKWLVGWSWLQLTITNVFMLHLFFVIDSYEPVLVYLYAGFIIANVFSYTTVLDGKRSALGGELAKLGFGFAKL